MSFRLYGDSRSGNCLKVRWTADRLDLDYDWIEVTVKDGQARTPEFLAVNPAGQVPVVVFDDGFVLPQSAAIMLHLCETHGGGGLIPADARDRARMYQWLMWEQYSHEPYIAVARYEMSFLGRPRETLEPRLFERGHAALALMEQTLQQAPWFAGPGLSLADIALVAYTRVAGEGGFDLAPYAAVRAWIGRVERELPIH
jgi:glutathione S-transferase